LNGKIFLLQEGNELVEMIEQEYISEDILQDLIAKYPNLLAGDEMDEYEPRKWLLVEREQVLPYDETGLNFFKLDHLFLDQDGIPTIVETKRSSDYRLRREVVAQMLDYAANALIYLPVDIIKSKLISNYPEKDLEKLLNEKLELEITVDEFWMQVKNNLEVGKIRLVFVADEIPTELVSIVEFLNKQMDPAEVFAVEVKQYIGEGLKTLVPRLLGQTAESRMKKIISNKKLDETTFLEHLDDDEKAFFKELLGFAQENHLNITWSLKSVSINIVKDGNTINILRAYCNLSAFGQSLFATAGNISTKIPNGESILKEYNKLDDFTTKVHDGYSFNLQEMDEKQTERFYEVLSLIIERINHV